jgi:hypothetical protein
MRKKTLIWVLGSASVGGLALFLASKRNSEVNLEQPVVNDAVQTQVPEGYRRVKQAEVTPSLTEIAKEVLAAFGKSPLGTQVPFTYQTADMLAIIEQHYHEPGGPLKPWGPHKGVSLFVRMGQSIPIEV